MRVLVTGASGFCGRHLCQYAISKGAKVLGLAQSRDVPRGVTRIQGDISGRDAVDAALALSNPDWIFHLAAALPESGATDEDFVRVNVLGTHQLLAAAAEIPDKRVRVLVVSSSAIYGQPDDPDTAISEDSPLRPISLYATTKIAQEALAEQFFNVGKVDTVRVRGFNLTGPGEPTSLVCSRVAQQVARIECGLQEPVVTARMLTPRRDFLDVRDAVGAYWAALESGVSGDVYNVCSGSSVSVGEIAQRLAALSERDDLKIIGDRGDIDRPGGISGQVGDPSRLRAASGWVPTTPLETSLKDLLASWRLRIST
jgi:GDP-4-dehydro-6-deoxy-D-mannose reductase